MKFLIIIILLTSCSLFKKPDGKTINSPASKDSPYVILISVDGLRHDYIDKYHPPTLSSIKSQGLSSKSLAPIFPSKTFPNHYSIITGLYAENHGLINNSFYDKNLNRKYSMGDRKQVTDGIWYQGEPLWVTAKKNDMASASFFWVGSEAAIAGHRPDYYFDYDGKIPGETRVDQVIEWLKLDSNYRPHFITLYFSEVDSAGHEFGPNSPEVKSALFNIDDYINRLMTKLKTLNLPVNIILVSDHGMTEISEKKKIILPQSIINNNNIDIEGRGSLSLVYFKNKNVKPAELMEQLAKVPNLNVYDRNNIPERFHFKNNQRIPEIILSPELGYYIASPNKMVSGGTHGYDPKNMDMHGVFVGIGPNIKPGKINTFENIHIYPFISGILKIKPNTKIDGDKKVLENFIQ